MGGDGAPLDQFFELFSDPASSRGRAPDPELLSGFGFLPQLLQALGGASTGGLGEAFNTPQLPLGDIFSRNFGAANLGLGFAGALAGPTAGAFQEGISTGFAPDIEGLEARLLPALERSFSRGEAAIRESAAGAGTLSSTSTPFAVGDLRGGLESGLLSQLAGIQGQGALQGQTIQAGLTGAGLGLPFQAANAFAPILSQGLEQSRFGAGQSFAGFEQLAALLGNLPAFVPRQTPSGVEAAHGKGPDGGGGSAGGTLGGVAALFCWVARAVYGDDDPRWLLARHYVLNMADDDLRDAYATNGEALARIVEDNDPLRATLRRSFDVFVDRATADLAAA
ncbi:MAG: hypothetical protein V3S43_06390 [Acidimicrobiia bacterium]